MDRKPTYQVLEQRLKELGRRRREHPTNPEEMNKTPKQKIGEGKQADKALRESEEKYRTILEDIEDGYYEIDLEGNLTVFNASFCRILAYSKEELMGMNLRALSDEENARKGYKAFNKVYTSGVPSAAFTWELRRKDTSKRQVEASVSLIADSEGKPIGFRGIIRDVTERTQAESRLTKESLAVAAVLKDMLSGDLDDAQTEKQVLDACISATDSAYGMIGKINEHGKYDTTTYNSQTLQDCAFPEALAWDLSTGMTIRGIWGWPMLHDEPLLCNDLKSHPDRVGHPEGHVPILCFLGVPLKREEEVVGMVAVANKPGGYSEADLKTLSRLANIIEVSRKHRKALKEANMTSTELERLVAERTAKLVDTNRRLMDEITKREKLEARLLQSQKMEAIGTLAGGVAHDFNNLLTTIMGNAHLALTGLGKDDPLCGTIEDIEKAGEAGASLTRQLLAFSRRQVIQPKVLDLNEVLKDMEKIISRLIGEDIELLTIPGPELGLVQADPGQMEQVIMNLVVNAKDAMPKGGKLNIETANVDLDVDYFREHGLQGQLGPYVMLSVSDDGIGMDKETQARIFEPFYTTKRIGSGTGLGLSTVYGIVKQNNGFLWVYSEPERGSTFKVYLPKAEGDVTSEKKEQYSVTELCGTETVLIIEDDEGLREFARKFLTGKGYRVLTAENGEDALRLSEAHDGSIDLMITDVVMPKMGGKETAERLQGFCPHLKVIYMSGYTDNAIVRHGVLAPGLNFIEKPFAPEGLVRKVREVLDK